jgi:pSer/pThr/pTyr-binding forkhead associated (FHA) protein
VRVLDDRSLNGVFVNGARVEGKVLQDGDEIIVGRHRLSFINVAVGEAGSARPDSPSLNAGA